MSAMITAAVVVVGGSMVAANQAKQAAKGAANAQKQAAQAGLTAQERQFNAMQELMAPYVQGGQSAFSAQQNLVGLGGPDAQKKALEELQASPQFQAMTQQGENAILQRASATGGLRGGNTQAALAQFRPQVLNQLLEQRFGQLGSLAQLGQASAAGQAAQGMQFGRDQSGLLGQLGQAQAGGLLAQGQANAAPFNTMSSLAASYLGTKF